MSFHSYAFICLFLPVTLIGYVLIGRHLGRTGALRWLVFASMAFYALWSVPYTLVLIASIGVNHGLARAIASRQADPRSARRLVIAGVLLHLGALAYFKYTNFFIDNINLLLAHPIEHLPIVLPLGISFFTFSQIVFLLDTYNQQVVEHRTVHYFLFASFFPYITAGPIVSQKEMMSQYARDDAFAYRVEDLAAGLTLFALGLFKKIWFADGIAPYANSVFDATGPVSMADAWLGAGAYTLQLYFDFSGYTDMALGLACMFGFRLPLNFNSPLKATSIIDFWQRWHITMTRFFTTYIYTPIAVGLMRRSVRRKYDAALRFSLVVLLPGIVTFTLAGLWHGAGWTFVMFGLVHGVALAVNHAWRELRLPAPPRILAWAVTMLVVVVALIFFRSARLDSAWTILGAMVGTSAAGSGATPLLQVTAVLPWIAILGAIALFAPNTQEILGPVRVTSDEVVAAPPARWRPSFLWAIGCAVVFVIALMSITGGSDFIYYKF